jgi:hypothetical protein
MLPSSSHSSKREEEGKGRGLRTGGSRGRAPGEQGSCAKGPDTTPTRLAGQLRRTHTRAGHGSSHGRTTGGWMAARQGWDRQPRTRRAEGHGATPPGQGCRGTSCYTLQTLETEENKEEWRSSPGKKTLAGAEEKSFD